MKRNPIDTLLDVESNENVFIKDERGYEVAFKQICVLSLDDQTYALLQPVKLPKNMEENDALVFEIVINQNTNESDIVLVKDVEVIDEVFDAYEEALEEEDSEERY